VEKYGEYNTAHARCMLGDLEYGNTLSKCVIYLTSTTYIQGVTGGTDQTSGGCSLC